MSKLLTVRNGQERQGTWVLGGYSLPLHFPKDGWAFHGKGFDLVIERQTYTRE